MQFRPQPRKLERGKGRYENSLSSLPPSPVYSASVHPFLHFPLPSFPLSPSRQHPLTFTSHFFLSPPSPLPLSAHFSFWQVIALCKRALLPSSFLLDRRRRYGGEGKKEITQAANRPCCPGGIALYTYIESVSLLPATSVRPAKFKSPSSLRGGKFKAAASGSFASAEEMEQFLFCGQTAKG